MISLREAFLLNEQVIFSAVAWSHDTDDLSEILPKNDPAQDDDKLMNQALRLFNSHEVCLIMSILSQDALKFGGEKTRVFSLGELSKTIDSENPEAAKSRLRDRILPYLTAAGFIEGFRHSVQAGEGHDISISTRGLNFFLRYLTAVHDIMEPVQEEIRDLRSEISEES